MKVLKVKNLNFGYNGSQILHNVSLEVERGELVAILGPNGAGKSTLMKCLAGVFKCKGVEVFGKPINEYSQEELAKIIGYVPQAIVPGFMRVFDTVLLGRRPYMGLKPSKKDIEAVKSTLKMLKIDHLALKPLNKLSGGELQKVNIARALAQEPEILLMDEPTNNLDLRSQVEVMKIAREFVDSGKTAVIIMHDVNLALRFADRFVFMKDGRIIKDGGRNVLTPELFEEVYGVRGIIAEVQGVPVVIPALED
ncbi:iron ABC transporter ATP-binding protein [Thermococcus guaymasensis DSM 11113]|uniref:Iron ABC transporter ATP-binding protein n=1 Tax=Thermococcus guaymasensis DSM 11113 TaxID=1432656 RepID=A0A0X1KMB8_9EURY|nr:ABC transporter ATP-binding protein [Thermococcus guaymasensis]AJC72412.1 iron ABC transporter ATP-binding protein [Thermococcus guaymasensis DSM 11113]